MKIIARRNVLLLVLAVHVTIDAILISIGSIDDMIWMILNSAIFFAMLTFPIAQGCLIALWAAIARTRFSLRLPLAVLGTVAPLIVFLRLSYTSVFDALAPVLTCMLATQLLAVLLLVNAGRLLRWQFRFWRSGWTEADALRTQFTLRQLLTWTAILAITLGIGRVLFGWLGWTTDAFVDEQFYPLQMEAVYNALYALLTLALFTVPVRWPVRILLFPLIVAACGALEWSKSLVLERLYGPGSAVDPDSLILVVSQIIYHTITLWPLWMCGYIGPRDVTDTDPHETTPTPARPFAQ